MKKNILMLLASGIALSLASCTPQGDNSAMHFEDESKWDTVYNCIKDSESINLKISSETQTIGKTTTKDSYTIKMTSDSKCISISKKETFTTNDDVTEENTAFYWYRNNYDKTSFTTSASESTVYGAMAETYFKNGSVANTVLYDADSNKTENKLSETQSEAIDEMMECIVSYIKNNYSINLTE